MGHHISAVLLTGPFDEVQSHVFDMKAIRLREDLTLLPLNASYCDFWSEKLGIYGFVSERPLLNSCVVHSMVNSIASNPLFAVIDTDYFGGAGSQAAAVYHGTTELMPPETSSTFGPINRALRRLGVNAYGHRDEFETVGLHRFRDFSDLFERY
jgi:hypothetical protein